MERIPRGSASGSFITKLYDKEYLDKANDKHLHELVYFESSLSLKAIKLAEGFDAVCVFVNDPHQGNDRSDHDTEYD